MAESNETTRCPECIEHPGWAHGDVTRRQEPADVCRACYGSGVGSAVPVRIDALRLAVAEMVDLT